MNFETKHVYSELPYSSTLVRTLVITAQFLGTLSLMAWLAFVFHGGFGIVKIGAFGETQALVFDAVLCLVFFAQHNVMARSAFRRWMANYLHEDLHGAVFTICSAVPLLAAIVLWQKSDDVIIPIEGVWRWAMHLVFVLGFLVFHYGIKALGKFDMFGIETAQRRLKGVPPPPPMPFTVRGFYRVVRHPLYLACLMMIWSCPNFTSDRLLHNVLWTLWIAAGTVLEERELSLVFGDDYRKYQRSVPMLIPWRMKLRINSK